MWDPESSEDWVRPNVVQVHGSKLRGASLSLVEVASFTLMLLCFVFSIHMWASSLGMAMGDGGVVENVLRQLCYCLMFPYVRTLF